MSNIADVQAFEVMDELLDQLCTGAELKSLNIGSISIMGKAGILPGKKGDIILATAHVVEGTTDNYMVDNDLAVGRIVEYLSHTPYWKNMLIVITEDDAQNGVDHVDAHRSVLMLISPWVKRKKHGAISWKLMRSMQRGHAWCTSAASRTRRTSASCSKFWTAFAARCPTS